jgi:hypothetical protein
VSALDPKKLFKRLATDIPRELHGHTFIVGSLAAAYHHRRQLQSRAVNTKDADIVVHPAGDVRSCREMAEHLLTEGWVRTDNCYPSPQKQPSSRLRAIRLHPKRSKDYFIELLALPRTEQTLALLWTPVRLSDGWYGAPAHRFMRLTAAHRMRSAEGLEYASPATMALANLLSHRRIGSPRMSEPMAGRQILRSAKDLGRVLALAWLGGPDEVAAWADVWQEALRSCFPRSWRTLCPRVGMGLARLLEDDAAFEEAHFTTTVGLLNGLDVSQANLRVVAEQLREDLLNPFARLSRRRR